MAMFFCSSLMSHTQVAVEEAGSRCDGQAGSDLETQVHPVFGSLDPREIMACLALKWL